MVRRPQKPFTVEIRSSRRKPSVHGAIEQEQPHVEWPSAMIEALREDPVPPPSPEIVAERQARRILPALDEPPPPPLPDDAIDDLDDDAPEADYELELVSESETPAPAEQPVSPEVTLAPPTPREKRARRSRDEFSRGERWKARLPAAVHRTRRFPRKS